MWPNLLMLVGALVWLAGELWGVKRNSDARDTTSEWVWWAELRWPIVRTFVFAFTVSLVGHLATGSGLVP